MSSSPKNPYQNLGKQFLKDLWHKREQGFSMPGIDLNTIRPEDIQFLLNRYPFLQLISTAANFSGGVEVEFHTAESGWVIQDYGDALSSSPGEYLYGYGDPYKKEEDDEGGEGGNAEFPAGKGTIINQAVMTAQEMIALALVKGWPGVSIVSGAPLMQWAAWMAASEYNLSLEGFEPSKLDEAKRKRVLKFLHKNQMGANDNRLRPKW